VVVIKVSAEQADGFHCPASPHTCGKFQCSPENCSHWTRAVDGRTHRRVNVMHVGYERFGKLDWNSAIVIIIVVFTQIPHLD
jgi:hypothetical protein